MMRFAPKMALAAATALLALLDWTAGTTIAEPGDNAGPPSDEMVPGDASLENTFQATAEIDSVALRVQPAGRGYVLVATNPLAEDREVEVEVKVLETSINPIARMAPIPQEVSSVKVHLACAAGQTVRRELQLAGLAPGAPLPRASSSSSSLASSNAPTNTVLGGPGLRSFRVREFLIARPTPARAQAQRQSARRSSEFGLFQRPTGQTVLRLALAAAPMTASSSVRSNSLR